MPSATGHIFSKKHLYLSLSGLTTETLPIGVNPTRSDHMLQYGKLNSNSKIMNFNTSQEKP